MAGDWMKVELELPDKPEVYAIAGMINKEPEFVVGALIKVWAWFDKHTVDGNAYGVTLSLPDKLTGVTGFGESMLLVGWLEQKDKLLIMPKFDRHTSASAKNRALTSKRVTKSRTKQQDEMLDKCNDVSVTKSLPREEKRREKKNNKTLINDDFSISDSVREWAKEKGHNKLDKHLEHFINVCKAKAYTYADWDRAFMNAISSNWAKIENLKDEPIPEWKRGLL